MLSTRPGCVCDDKLQVRRWGILWRPMELRLVKFEHTVNAIVRLHNFCRNHKVDVPTQDVGVLRPADVTFDGDGLISNDFFETDPGRTGRPAKDQAKISRPRERIRHQLEVAGFARPAHNIARNSNRTR